MAQERAAGLDDLRAIDKVRREYLAQLQAYTGRNTVLYATRWNVPDSPSSESVLVNEEDVQAFMEVGHGLKGGKLDLILHSPGGSAEATEALVKYIRKKFTDIRVIVPYGAFSAATMWACSADRIVMGKHSYLGPIDPQMGVGGMIGYAPAQAILDQFALAKKECKDVSALPPWVPILEQYGPALIVQCKEQLRLARELVRTWLKQYMFAGLSNKSARASGVARALANHSAFKSHGRHIDREDARNLGGAGQGLLIEDLESDQRFQDHVLSVYHATMITFTSSGVSKIVENHNGRAFIKALMAPSLPEAVGMSEPDASKTPKVAEAQGT